jgi:hypothetical protein
VTFDDRMADVLLVEHRALFSEWGAVGEARLKQLEGTLAEKQAAGASVVLAGVLDRVREAAATIASTPASLEQLLAEEGLGRVVEVHFAFAGAIDVVVVAEMLLGLRERPG